MKKIGIIGGAGPMASCQLYKMIVEICQKKHGCKNDFDFPEIVLISYPFTDMLSKETLMSNKNILTLQLQRCLDTLHAQGCDIVAIACNTLHTLLDEIKIPNLTFVLITEVVLRKAQELSLSRLLLLATSTSVECGLYSTTAMDIMKPNKNEQVCVDRIIKHILNGTICLSDAAFLAHIIKRNKVEGVILGCTELPLLHEKYQFNEMSPIQILDSSLLLAEALVSNAVK